MPLESGPAWVTFLAVLARIWQRLRVMDHLVSLQALFEREPLLAEPALKRAVLGVRRDVFLVVLDVQVDAVAVTAVVSRDLRVCVDLLVTVQQRRPREALVAHDTQIIFLLGVRQNVLSEIVFGEETFVAELARMVSFAVMVDLVDLELLEQWEAATAN